MTGPNAEQREYWNSADSREWIDAASRYDEMLAPFADRVLEAAALSRGERVLDVGCGNGATTLAAAELVGTEGEAIGIDLSLPMLDNARARAAERGLTNATFVAADAQVATLGGPFDAIVSRFGVMFFDDPDAACGNLVGSLGTGGRVAFACWRTVPENEWVAVQATAAFARVPQSGDDFTSDGPGPFRYGDPAALVRSLERAGLRDVVAEPFDTTMLLGGSGTLADTMRFVEASGMTRRLLGDASPEQRAAAIDAVRDALAAFETHEGVRLGAAVWIVSGRRR